MSTKAIVGLLIAVVVVATAVWYYSNNSSGGMMQGGTPMGTENTQNTGTGSLASLFAMTGSYTCTINSRDPNAATDGTVHISNGSVRGDFLSSVSTNGGQNVQAHMIKTGNDVFIWSDVMPQGIKMNAAMMMSGSGSSGSSAAFDPNVSVDYSCEPTALDASLFVAPVEVQFMSL